MWMRGSGERSGSWAPAHLSLPTQAPENVSAPQYPLISPMNEYFFDGTSDIAIFPPPVSIEPTDVDFGACPGPGDPNPVPLCLMNHTKGKITVVWTRRSDCPFWVTPDTCDVPPLKSMAMRLHFHPPYPNCLYAVELEAFAVYKVCAGRRHGGGEGCLSSLEPEQQGGVGGGGRCCGIYPLCAKLLLGWIVVLTGLPSPRLTGLPWPRGFLAHLIMSHSYVSSHSLQREHPAGVKPLGKIWHTRSISLGLIMRWSIQRPMGRRNQGLGH